MAATKSWWIGSALISGALLCPVTDTSATVIRDENVTVVVTFRTPAGAHAEVVRENGVPSNKLLFRADDAGLGNAKVRVVNFDGADARFDVREDRNVDNFQVQVVVDSNHIEPIHVRSFSCASNETLKVTAFPPAKSLSWGSPLGAVCLEITRPIISAAGAVPDGAGGSAESSLAIEKDASGDLTLSWAASCNPEDQDYEIYEGILGDFGSHVPLACSTGKKTTKTIEPGDGDKYYLVVPRNLRREGGYGKRSDGSPRGQGAEACLIQSEPTCLH